LFIDQSVQDVALSKIFITLNRLPHSEHWKDRVLCGAVTVSGAIVAAAAAAAEAALLHELTSFTPLKPRFELK
jgi:NhaP-type Na+/H+ or K+/H+ antiporter